MSKWRNAGMDHIWLWQPATSRATCSSMVLWALYLDGSVCVFGIFEFYFGFYCLCDILSAFTLYYILTCNFPRFSPEAEGHSMEKDFKL